MEKNKLVCPSCKSERVKVIDHLPVDISIVPFDTELYCKFRCINCTHKFTQVLTLSYQPKEKPKEGLKERWKKFIKTLSK